MTMTTAIKKRMFGLLAASLLVLLCSANAMADMSCRANGDIGNYRVEVGARPVPRDAVVGSSLWGKFGGWPGYSFKCGVDTEHDRDTYLTLSTSVPPVAGFNDVYPTNVAGIGVRYHFAVSAGPDDCGVVFDMGITNSSLPLKCHIMHGTDSEWRLGTSVEFIKTGPIGAATLVSFPSVSVVSKLNQGPYENLPNMYSGAVSGSTTVVACSVSDVPVTLGDYKSTDFAGVGTGTRSVDVKIKLTGCPAGINKVRYTIDPVTPVVDTANSIVKLDSSSRAGGVGVQMLGESGAVLPLSQPQVFNAYNYGGGSFDISLKARYVQTEKLIKLARRMPR